MAEIGPNWNSGGWADNGPGTGGYDPNTGSPVGDTASDQQNLYTARGGAASFDSNKYSIDQLQYPSDLMGSLGEYGGNYVIFYINIASDSKLLKDGMVETVNDSTPRDYGDLSALSNKYGSNVDNVVGGAALAAGFAGLAAGATLKTFGTITGTAIGADLALRQVGSTFSGQKRRLKTAVALHAPNTMQTTYSVNYEEEDLDIYAMGLAAAGGGSAMSKAALQGNMSNVMENPNLVAGAVAAGLKIPGTGGISRLTGLAPNPRKEQLFKNVNFRTFTFDYQFYPRDASEAANIENIIYQFKLHMHPEFKDANNFLYVYPSEFDIFYYNGTQENLHVNRHTSCVLTDMVVNYAPNGQFTSFRNGMPTQINITLTFKELATLTKEKIQDKL
jgi:hypothetical protein